MQRRKIKNNNNNNAGKLKRKKIGDLKLKKKK